MGSPAKQVSFVAADYSDSAVFSHDGKWVATACTVFIGGSGQQCTLKVFDARTGAIRCQFTTAPDMSDLAWSPDDRFVAATGYEAMTVFDAASGARRWTKQFDTSSNVNTTYSLDGQTLYTSGYGAVLALDANNGNVRWQVAHDDRSDMVHQTVLSRDGKFLAVASGGGYGGDPNSGGNIRVRHASNGALKWEAHVVEDRIYSCAFSADGRKLLYYIAQYSGENRNVMVDANTGARLGTLPNLASYTQSRFTFSPDNRYVVVAGDGKVRVFNVETRAMLYEIGANLLLHSLPDFSPDSKLYLIAAKRPITSSETLWALETETGALQWTMVHPHNLQSARFNRAGTHVATASYGGATVFELVALAALRHKLVHQGPVRAVAFARDGANLATASTDKNARVFTMANGQETAHRSHTAAVNAVEFTPDGQSVLSGSDDNTARLFSTGTAGELLTVTHDGPVRAVTISRDGRRAATASTDGSARILNLDTLTSRRLAHEGAVTAVAFTPDATQLATGCADGAARVFNTATGARQLLLAHNGPITAVAFGTDSYLLATASEDGTARLFDIRNGTELRSFTHPSPVRALAFSLDGRTLATGCADAARLYTVATGQLLRSIAHPKPVRTLAFDRSGKLLASAAEDGVRVHSAGNGELKFLLPDGAPAEAAVFDPTGTLLAVACADNAARVYDIPVE
ncbi:WD40 repeat domain-containing protein [Nocardia sp. NPDC050712]|uniref:WD40 repeat domain-containing protein n=1 Tax=Nocardia sp. NPDC050712 TaxID=3155518 RepID=UPI0033CF369A